MHMYMCMCMFRIGTNAYSWFKLMKQANGIDATTHTRHNFSRVYVTYVLAVHALNVSIRLWGLWASKAQCTWKSTRLCQVIFLPSTPVFGKRHRFRVSSGHDPALSTQHERWVYTWVHLSWLCTSRTVYDHIRAGVHASILILSFLLTRRGGLSVFELPNTYYICTQYYIFAPLLSCAHPCSTLKHTRIVYTYQTHVDMKACVHITPARHQPVCFLV